MVRETRVQLQLDDFFTPERRALLRHTHKSGLEQKSDREGGGGQSKSAAESHLPCF